MNILLLCDEYPPGKHGGIGTIVQLLARSAAAAGHRVVVAGLYLHEYGGEDRFEDEGVTVFRFRYGPRNLRAYPVDFPGKLRAKLWKVTGAAQKAIRKGLGKYGAALNAIIRDHRIDIVEMPEFQGYMPFVREKTVFPRLPVPVVVKLHGSLSYFAFEAGERPLPAIFESESAILRQGDAIAGVSRYTAERTAQYFQLETVPAVLYNGIELPAVAATASLPEPLVVYTGTLVRKKGIYQLMKAWNIVHARYPEARLEVYGKGDIEGVRRLLGPTAVNSVTFMGHRLRAELMDALSRSRLAVFPSYAECFALGPMEAMAAGTAVIYSTRTSGPELIRDGVDGLLADPDDVEHMSAQIIDLLTNTELREHLAKAGRSRVAEQFAIGKVLSEHIRFYQSVIDAPK